MRSPGLIPAVTRPFATAATSAENCAAVMSRQAPACLRRNETVLGASSALVKTASAMPPLAGTVASGGTASSRMLYSSSRLDTSR